MPQQKRDYYEILSVSKTAPVEDVKKAYRACALKYHPDRNPGDKKAEEKFKEATEAYQVLADAQKRELYDQYGHEGLQSRGGFGTAGFGASGFGDIFEDIFEDFFGGGGVAAARAGVEGEGEGSAAAATTAAAAPCPIPCCCCCHICCCCCCSRYHC